jgi:hypothetical protein
MGWIAEEEKHSLEFAPLALEQIRWLQTQGLSQLESFIIHQLEFEPTNAKKKRVKPHAHYPLAEDHFTLAYRTWRIDFSLHERMIVVQRVYSGYSVQDLSTEANSYNDPHHDKELHRQFLAKYAQAGLT